MGAIEHGLKRAISSAGGRGAQCRLSSAPHVQGLSGAEGLSGAQLGWDGDSISPLAEFPFPQGANCLGHHTTRRAETNEDVCLVSSEGTEIQITPGQLFLGRP